MVAIATTGLLPQYEAIFTSHSRTPLLNEFMLFAAENLVYLIPLALLYLWFTPNERRADSAFRMALSIPRFTTNDGKSKAVFVFVTIVVSLAISYAMGQLYSHPAPYSAGYETLVTESPENSFPNQHTTVAFAFVWPLLYLQDQWRTGLVALVLAVPVGISRVYIGVHYPIDIIGAIAASLIGFTLVYTARDLVMGFADWCIRIENRLLTALSRVS